MRRIPISHLIPCAAILLAGTSTAAAQAAPPIHEARHALRAYDTEGYETTDVIARLGAFADRARNPIDRREARYLRAVAATDLLVIAERRADIALRARVGEAVGVVDDALERTLRAELETLTFGAYAETAQDARRALALLAAMRSGDAPTADGRGLRRDLLFLTAARVAAREGRLAELGADPCEGADACPAPYVLYDAEGRRAADALRRAGEALHRLEHAAEYGDPLAGALRDAITEDRLVLETLTLRATPRLPDAPLLVVGEAVPARAPDAVVVITAEEVRWGMVPAIGLGDDGQPRALAASGVPSLPALERIALPPSMRPALVPIGGVERALERIAGAAPGAVVAIGAAPDTPGHLLARVLLSVDRLEMSSALLVGVGADGALRGVPLRVASARDTDRPRAPVRVKVRLGGYSLHTSAGFSDIPRVRDADDRLRFDVSTLAAGARRAPYDHAELSFMSAVRSGSLLAAAFAVAPAEGILTVALP